MLDQLSYKVLVNRYKNKIFSYAFYMVKNRMDAEDISQEVLIRIWKNLGKFKISAAGSWIMRTTHNLCIDYLRKEQLYKKRSVFINDDFEDNIEDENKMNRPEVSALQKITNDKVKSAISKLPENLKSVFVLYEIEGFKYKEISDVLDMPINSVKVYIMRARKKLQEELKEYAGYEI